LFIGFDATISHFEQDSVKNNLVIKIERPDLRKTISLCWL